MHLTYRIALDPTPEDTHAQPFAHLARAWQRFLADIKAARPANGPQFKKKGLCRESLYIANDQFSLAGQMIDLPRIGAIRMTEALRFGGSFGGRILGATLLRPAGHWFIAVQVEVPDSQFSNNRKKSSSIAEFIHRLIFGGTAKTKWW